MDEREILERLYKAFKEARKHKRGTVDETKFDVNFLENLCYLRDDIIQRTYKPSRSVAFIISDPKMREIFAAPFRDRVMHHFVCDLIVPWWEKHLMECSYSCRKGKGTDDGRRDFYAKARKISKNFSEQIYVVKIDLESYFCNITRETLYDRVEWGLRRQFLVEMGGERGAKIYKMMTFLCSRIIFDDPIENVRIKGSIENWRKYPKHKSLFFQKKGKGIVIGNLTSQVFSNIFLDSLDRFCRVTLGIKGYGRYVDDAFFIIPASEKEQFFKEKLPQIREYIFGMGLKMNEKKTVCQDFTHGVEFLGVWFAPHKVLPGRRMRRNFHKVTKAVVSGEKDIECLVSYLGMFKHLDAQKFIKRTFNHYGLDYTYDRTMNSLFYTDPKMYEVGKGW